MIRRGVPEVEYHGDTTHLSASAAKILLGKRPPVSKWELEFGRIVHALLLEPERYERDFAVLDPAVVGVKVDGTPAGNPAATKAWKEAVNRAAAEGKAMVSPGDDQRAKAMVEAVMAHPTAATLVNYAHDRELSVYGSNPETEAPVRGRFDLSGGGYIADLKTCGDASPANFSRTCHTFGYHVSAANYLDLAAGNDMSADVFAFINVEREPTPGGVHRVSVIELDPRAVTEGRRLMAEACQRWLDLGRVVDLPGYGDGIHTVDLPPWAYRTEEDHEYQEVSS